jgi:eukaryotic-like serine/threonine-protein kinase
LSPSTPPGESLRDVVRFGLFEADLGTGELRKNGVKVKLQELPFRLLAALLERPGEIVTREELQAKLWPGGTFVDYERGLGTALNKVREALGDSAATPRFIETMPRRGYRFIAEVQKGGGKKGEAQQNGTPLPAEAAAQAHSTLNRRMAAIIAAAAVVIVLVSGAAYSRFSARPAPLTDQDVLVLADFTNTTGDAAFDGALRQALAFDLEESPFLKIMDDEEVNQTLKLMGRKAGEPISNDIAHEVCVREGQKATVGGSIASLGKSYAIALQAINCQTGATLAREQAEAEDKEHVVKAVAKAATGMRAKLGESLSSIQKTERERSEDAVTTNSLGALKAFQLGYDLMAQSDSNREAIPHFQRAVELDPNFASAYYFLGIAYGNIGQSDLEAEPLSKAFALVNRVSERERLSISGWYYQRVAHDLNKAIEFYQMQVRSYPRGPDGYHFLGLAYATKGEYEKALQQHQESGRLAPLDVIKQSVLARDYVYLDRFDEAKAVAARAFAQKLDGPGIHRMLLRIAYIQDDQAAQAREIQWLAGKPEEIASLDLQGVNALVHGQRRKAKELYKDEVEMGQRQRAGMQFPKPEVMDAQSDAWVGDCAAALKLKPSPSPFLCWDEARVQLVEEAAARNPPANPDDAGRHFQRGLAALHAGKGAEAAAEFQKILDHKGRNWGLIYAIAQLGLARGAVKAGDTARAKQAYQDLLALWKGADSDIPLLIEAREEYARLQ